MYPAYIPGFLNFRNVRGSRTVPKSWNFPGLHNFLYSYIVLNVLGIPNVQNTLTFLIFPSGPSIPKSRKAL